MSIEVDMIMQIMGVFGFFMGAYAALFKKKITIVEIVKEINELQLKK